ncbi:MAG: sulfotransferase domain-containing protein [Phycisphaerales bacterium]|nr:sulfotransferase domain-containing protein [Phycisphaerales bacterium]
METAVPLQSPAAPPLRAGQRAEVVSFPKSGRTWVELMVASVRATATGADVRSFLAGPDKPAAAGPGDLRIEFSHGHDKDRVSRGLGFSRDMYRARMVCLLVRDPRDVVVSSYYYERYQHARFSGSLAEFLRHDPASTPPGSKAARYGLLPILHWMNAWAANRDTPAGFHLARYEDFKRDTSGELARLCAFLGLPAEPEIIAAAVEFGSFDSMRRMELSGELAWHGLPSAKDPRGLKTRQGRAGAYRDAMTPDDIRWLDDVIASRLDPFFDCYRAPQRS